MFFHRRFYGGFLSREIYVGGRMEQEGEIFRNLADFSGTRGALQSNTRGSHRNAGGRLREEISFTEKWTGILGVGVESSRVSAPVQNRTASATYSHVRVERNFLNAAPEADVVYQAAPDLKIRGRVGMGYGIPGINQLTTAPSGQAGKNSRRGGTRSEFAFGLRFLRWSGRLDGADRFGGEAFAGLSPGFDFIVLRVGPSGGGVFVRGDFRGKNIAQGRALPVDLG